jgi:anti-sigma factor RsiW
MLSEELDFLLMQYLDPSLTPGQRAVVRRAIESCPEAKMLLRSHQKLDDLLRSQIPMPPIRWDRLAKRISAKIRRSRS